MEEMDGTPELHDYPRKLVCFPEAKLLQKPMSLCSFLDRSKRFSQWEESEITEFAKKWSDLEKIFENLGSFPLKEILNFHYCTLCHQRRQKIIPFT